MSEPRVTFYDTAPDARGATIAWLVEHAWSKRIKVLIHCADEPTAKVLDELLWTYKEESFIPHERAEGPVLNDPQAQIVLVHEPFDPHGAAILILEGPADFEFAKGFGHVIEFVDNRDQGRLEASRARFKAWAAAGIKPAYKKR